MTSTDTARQLGPLMAALLASTVLGACSGPQTRKEAGLLGYGTPGVSSYGEGPTTTLQEELDRCRGVPQAGAASQTQGLPAACSQLQRTARNQPGNTVR